MGDRLDQDPSDDRSWMDRCADDEHTGRGHHRGRGPKSWNRGDQQIYVEVCERLLHDRLIDPRGIEVEVEDGVVTLTGEARGAADPALVRRLVSATPGVKDVRVELRVNPNLPNRTRETRPDDDHIDKSARWSPILPM